MDRCEANRGELFQLAIEDELSRYPYHRQNEGGGKETELGGEFVQLFKHISYPLSSTLSPLNPYTLSSNLVI